MKNDMVDVKQLSRLFAKTTAKHSWQLPARNPEANCEWIMTQSGLPWLKLDLPVPYQTIAQEIDLIKDMFVDHREDYSNSRGWKGFTLHGRNEQSTRELEYYNDSVPYKWTDTACQLMPKTVRYFQEQFPIQTYRRLRVMLVEADGVIGVHNDGTLPGQLGPVNIAITQPDDCAFYMENYGVVPFAAGDAFMLNIANRHTVINNSTKPRYHIIVQYDDVKSVFKDIVEQSYRNLYAG